MWICGRNERGNVLVKHPRAQDVCDQRVARRLVGALRFLRRAARQWISGSFLFTALGCHESHGVEEQQFRERVTGRPYRVVTKARSRATERRPVLVVLHPYAYPVEPILQAYELRRRAVKKRDWILVVPEGTTDSLGHQRWNATAACCGEEPSGPDDVDYLARVLDDVAERIAIDRKRVFLLGVSNGGFMAHRFACEASERVRAYVSIAGAGLGPDDPPCRVAKPVSLLHVHGKKDEVIFYEGGLERGKAYPSARDSLSPWLEVPGGQLRRWTDTLHFMGPTVEVESYQWPSHRVELWTVPSGDHHLSGVRHAIPAVLTFLETS